MLHEVSVVCDGPCTHISARKEKKLTNYSKSWKSFVYEGTLSTKKISLLSGVKEMGIYVTDNNW